MAKFKNPKDYALWLVSCREYTTKKLRDKCIEKFPEDIEEIDSLIKILVQKKYVSDARFIENFIRSQTRQGQGRQKIFMKLLDKGAPKPLIDEMLNAQLLEEDVIGPAKNLMIKKSVQLKKRDPEISEYDLRHKLTAYLAGRGYDYATIKSVLSDEC